MNCDRLFVKKGLRTILSTDANCDRLVFVDKYDELDEHRMLDSCVRDLYSDDILHYLNERVAMLYACDVTDDQDCILHVRRSLLHPNWSVSDLNRPLWDKPVVCVGYECGNKNVIDTNFAIVSSYLTHMDVTGEVIVVEENMICLRHNQHIVISFRRVCDEEECMSLSELQPLFPKFLRVF